MEEESSFISFAVAIHFEDYFPVDFIDKPNPNKSTVVGFRYWFVEGGIVLRVKVKVVAD